MASPTPATPAEAASGTNPLLGVFFSPGAAMEELVRRPRFLTPLLAVTIVGAIVMTIGLQRGVMEPFIRHKMESNPRMEQLPPAQRERAIEMSVKVGSYMSVGGAVFGPTLGLLMTSGFFLFISNIVLGAKARFRHLMAIVSHAWLPHAVLGLISIPILLAKEPDTVDLQNIVALSNLSFLFDRTEQAKLYAIASGFDLFSFWVIGLLAIGLARLTGKSKAAVLPAIVAPWLIYVLGIKPLQG